MKNPYEKWYKCLYSKAVDKTILDEQTKEKKDIKVRTNITRVVKKTLFGKKETYAKVETVIYYENEVRYMVSEIKL